jgi:hypothetical protein
MRRKNTNRWEYPMGSGRSEKNCRLTGSTLKGRTPHCSVSRELKLRLNTKLGYGWTRLRNEIEARFTKARLWMVMGLRPQEV